MRRLALLLTLFACLIAPAPAGAGEKCPLDIATCIEAFGRMRERPWLGVKIDIDSTGTRKVFEVMDGSPARKAGIKAGDILQTINGKELRDWFAGKSGWTENEKVACTVLRGERTRTLKLELHHIPEETFARLIGTHMVEGHLAYMEVSEPQVH